jgi:FG-GAP-like repeat/FG-GAP repeat
MRRCGPVSLLAVLVSLTLAGPAAAGVGFDPQVTYGTGGTQPISLVQGFFHSDGTTDLAALNTGGSGSVGTLLSASNGTFGAGPGSPLGLPGGFTGPRDMAAGDLDNDGFADLVVGSNVGNGVAVYLASSGGGFTPLGASLAGVATESVAVGNVNGDANLDLVIAGANAPAGTDVRTYLGNGNGTFQAAPAGQAAAGSNPYGLALGDFNNDDRDDVLVSNVNSHDVTVLVNNGSGGLAASAQSPIAMDSAASPRTPAVGDLDDDGNLDAVVPAFNGQSGASILMGNGNGTFRSRVDLGTGLTNALAFAAAIADFDDDGIQDLALANQSNPGTVTVLVGTGSGTSFTSAGSPLAAGAHPSDIQAADFNDDGNPDLAVSNFTSSNVSVLLATPPSATVNASSLNFGNQRVNTQSSTQTVTLTNNGPQTIGPLAEITGDQAGDFVRINDRCSPSSVFLAPGQTCTIGVAARPKSLGAKTATLEISSFNLPTPVRVTLSVTGVPAPPGSQSAPQISGTPTVGSALTCSNGTWSNNPTSFAHQWLRNGVALPGQTNPTYTVVEADVGQRLTCEVTATNAGGSGQRTSSAVTPTASAPVLSVSIRSRQTINSVISRGLKFRPVCASSCSIAASVTGPVLPRKKRRSSKLAVAARTAIVGRTSATLDGGRARTLTVRINRAGRKALRRKRRARLRLTVIATPPSGQPSTSRSVGVTLKKAKRKKRRR